MMLGMVPMRAILFDFDHTLAHLGNQVDWDAARAEMIEIYEHAGFSRSTLESMPGAITLFSSISQSTQLSPADLAEAQAAASRVLEHYEEVGAAGVQLIPKATIAVSALLRAGVPLGIASSNSARVVRALLEEAGMSGAFGAIVGREDVNEPKPSPEALLLCCERMSVLPTEGAYIGDMHTDIAAALAAGLMPIGIVGGEDTRETLVEAGAHLVLDGLDQLMSAGILSS